MAHRKPTKCAQNACCVGYWTQAVNGWTLSAKYWTVRPRITDKSPKVKMQRVTESRIKRIEMSPNRKLRRNTISFVFNSK